MKKNVDLSNKKVTFTNTGYAWTDMYGTLGTFSGSNPTQMRVTFNAGSGYYLAFGIATEELDLSKSFGTFTQ